MALTRQTMTDEQRKSVALEYLKAFDKAGVTSDGGSILDLFAEDAQVYFPKWGLADGKEAIGRLFGDVGGTLKSIVHHYAAQEDAPVAGPEAEALSRLLKRHGFTFVGPTICQSYLQAIGCLMDHTTDCHRHRTLAG